MKHNTKNRKLKVMKIYLIEDNQLFAESIKTYLDQITSRYDSIAIDTIECVSKDYSQFLIEQKMLKDNLSLYFIDIDLKESMNGLDFAKQLRSFDYNSYIVFLTGHIEMTAITYQYNLKALNFIYKHDSRLKDHINGIFDQIAKELEAKNNTCATISSKERPSFITSYKGNHYRINIDDIIYIETHGIKKSLLIHTLTNVIPCSDSLSQLLEKLNSTIHRCHRSYAINLERVSEIQLNSGQHSVIFSTGESCPISKKYYKDIVVSFSNLAEK